MGLRRSLRTAICQATNRAQACSHASMSGWPRCTPSERARPRDCVRTLRRREPGRQPGRDAPGPARTGHHPRRRHRDIGRRAQRRGRRHGARHEPGGPSRRGLDRPHRRSGVPRRHWRRAWNLLRRDDHIISNDGLQALIAGTAIADTFGELAVPLRVVAADLETGLELVLASGPLRPGPAGQRSPPGDLPAGPDRQRGPRRRRGGQPGPDLPRARRARSTASSCSTCRTRWATGRCAPRSTWWFGRWRSRATSASTSSSSGFPKT